MSCPLHSSYTAQCEGCSRDAHRRGAERARHQKLEEAVRYMLRLLHDNAEVTTHTERATLRTFLNYLETK